MLYKKLNLGCGEDKKKGYLNVDFSPTVSPDIVHNLNQFPYPFKENSFELIEAFHVLEHLDKPFEVMKELHRILKPNGVLLVKVPHFSRGFTHAEHAHGFDITFPLYFNPSFTKSGYFGVNFKLEKMILSWLAHFHLMPFMGYGRAFIGFLRGVNYVVSFLANFSQTVTSRIWCYWVGGFEEIEFKFKCIK